MAGGRHQAGHVVPNTTYDYRFRVVTADGESLGPAASHRVDDTRLEVGGGIQR